MPGSRTLAKLAIRSGFVNDPTKVILSNGTSGPPPNPGSFTTLSLTGNVAATSTTTGTLIVTGGIGASGAIYAGGGLFAPSSANSTFTGLTVSNSSFGNNAYAHLALTAQGSRGLYLTLPCSGVGSTEQAGIEAVNVDLQLRTGNALAGSSNNRLVLSTTAATFTASVAVLIQNTTDAAADNTGALQVAGGIWSSKKIRCADTIVTGAPGGSTNPEWRLGAGDYGGGAPTPDSTIVVSVGGFNYAIAAQGI